MLDGLKYDHLTGIITRRFYSSRKGERIKQVGSLHKHGYLHCKVGSKHYKVHRLAWFLYYGEFPKNDIDHINGIRTDNRIENLRFLCPNCHSQTDTSGRIKLKSDRFCKLCNIKIYRCSKTGYCHKCRYKVR